MIAQDKLYHLIVGAAINALGGAIFGLTIGFALVVLAGAGKEIYDYYSGKGTPEVMDFVATIAGGVLVILAYKIIGGGL